MTLTDYEMELYKKYKCPTHGKMTKIVKIEQVGYIEKIITCTKCSYAVRIK